MRRLTFGGAIVLVGTVWLGAQPLVPPLDLFFAAASLDERASRTAIDALAPSWRDGYTSMIVDMARLLRPGATAPDDTGAAEFAERFDADADAGSPGSTRFKARRLATRARARTNWT